jgi:hypothetical protein
MAGLGELCFVSALLSSKPGPRRWNGARRWELIDLELAGEEHLRLIAGFRLSIYAYNYITYISSTLFQFFVGSHLLYSTYLCISSLCVCVADLQILENLPALTWLN